MGRIRCSNTLIFSMPAEWGWGCWAVGAGQASPKEKPRNPEAGLSPARLPQALEFTGRLPGRASFQGGRKVHVPAWEHDNTSNFPNRLWRCQTVTSIHPKLLLKMECSSSHNSSLIVKELIKATASLLTEFYGANFAVGQAKSGSGCLHCGLLAPDKRR